MHLQHKIGAKQEKERMTPTQKEAKAKMKTKAVYYGDCLTHLTQ